MKKRVSRVGNIILISICMGVSFGCASDQGAERSGEEQAITQSSVREEQSAEEENPEEIIKEIIEERKKESSEPESDVPKGLAEEFSPGEQDRKNEEKFFEEAEKQGIDRQEADTYLQILKKDNLFQDGAMALTLDSGSMI